MTVHFIGAGPGAPDLLTLRGRDLIAACPVCLYAGSLVPETVLAHCPEGARVVNTAPLDLDQIIGEIRAAHAAGQDVARLHSGDLSVWSAMGEQMRRLRTEGIPVTVTPGVPAFAAAAASLGAELTLPGLAQSVVLTRTPGRASGMPEGETLANFAATGATLAIHLAIQNIAAVVEDLAPDYGADCPVAVVYRASWPDERIVRGTLADIEARLTGAGIERTALILVGPALTGEGFAESCLYAPEYDRRYRPQSAESPWAGWAPEAEGRS
ncbi:MAG: precorrin-4 C(11)-methyltransferase [Pseudomonadota bacterium]